MNEDRIKTFLESLAREAPNYQIQINSDALRRLGDYFSLLSHWNQRLHLVAPCSPEEFALRHVLESLLLTQHLPYKSEISDIGSGAGLPLIPCLIVRPDLKGFLFESSQKKSAFLREALKQMATRATVISKRFQETESPAVQFVSCRAIEKFAEVLPQIVEWAPANCTLLLFAGEKFRIALEHTRLAYTSILLPKSERRFLYVAQVNK